VGTGKGNRGTGRETRKDEGTNNGLEEDVCPFCFSPNIETIMLNFDAQHGIVRCKDCFKRMRIKDYQKLQLALKIKRGGTL
tara:strand:- start:125 stop:367 length:243 start_codon:yes stop_codon:yes gene_type:complete